MMSLNIVKYVNFHNNTDLSFIIDTWVDGSSKLQSLKVSPNDKLVIHSSLGEWHMHTMFNTVEDMNLWFDKGLEKCVNIGKFRSSPCASGNYSWLDADDIFDCVYTELETENEVKGLITLSLKSQ